jgi:hypothetical protein
MNTAAWQSSKRRWKRDAGPIIRKRRDAGSSKRLVVFAVAITLWRGDVAILDVVILGGRRWWFPGRFIGRFLGFAVILAGKFALFASSAHLTASGRSDRVSAQSSGHVCDINLTVVEAVYIAATEQSFLPFSDIQRKGRRNQSMIRKSENRFSERSCSKQTDEILIRLNRIMILEPRMKKPKIELEEQQPRKIVRADKAPTSGYSLVVDGHFKSHHDTVEAAEEKGMALKTQFQMLQVQVYDAATKTRSLIEWPAPA